MDVHARIRESSAIDRLLARLADDEIESLRGVPADAWLEPGVDLEAVLAEHRAALGDRDHVREVLRPWSADALCAWMTDEIPSFDSFSDDTANAAATVLQSAQVTTLAISLLLEHGYVADAHARWRGLYELACTAALIARAPDPAETSRRYLVHGGYLLNDHPANREPWAVEGRYRERDYEWLRGDHPGERGPFRQRRLFDEAALRSARFDAWARASNAAVHMGSSVAAQGRQPVGAAPAGYLPGRAGDLALITALALGETVAHCCALVASDHDPRGYLAWALAFHDAVTRMVAEDPDPEAVLV